MADRPPPAPDVPESAGVIRIGCDMGLDWRDRKPTEAERELHRGLWLARAKNGGGICFFYGTEIIDALFSDYKYHYAAVGLDFQAVAWPEVGPSIDWDHRPALTLYVDGVETGCVLNIHADECWMWHRWELDLDGMHVYGYASSETDAKRALLASVGVSK